MSQPDQSQSSPAQPSQSASPTPPGILVMGATGNVGGEIARQLTAAGVRFAVGVRRPADVQERFAGGLPGQVTVRAFDAADPATYPALDGVRRLFLLWPPGTSVQRDVKPVIEAARARGVQGVVFLSILGAERIRVVPHRSVERLLERSGMAWVFLRASYFMQNLSSVHQSDIRLRNEIFLPAGSGKTSFVDLRDVAAAGVAALTGELHRAAYDLTGEEALDYDDVAASLSVALGRRILYTRPSALEFLRVSRGRGVAIPFVLFMLAEYTVARLGLAGRLSGDLAGLLGRSPIRVRQFAEDYREVWL